MRRSVSLALLILAVSALPDLALAKDRGCGNRLATLYETERAFEIALQRREGVDEARGNFLRSREKAMEEGCLTGTQWDRNTKYDYDSNYRDRFTPGPPPSQSPPPASRYSDRPGSGYERKRFDELLDTGHRRGLNREEFRELEDLRRRLGL